MIIAAMITYNDMPVIEKSVESFIDQVDKFVCVDGKYDDFDGDLLYSHDKTLDYIHSLPHTVVIYAGGLYENEKRSMYLDHVSDGDTLIVIDTDEVIHGQIKPLDVDVGIIDFKEARNIKAVARIFKYREGLRYRGVHYVLQFEDGQPFNTHRKAVPPFTDRRIKEFYIEHLNVRDDNRRFAKEAYYKRLKHREDKYRKTSKFTLG